MSHAQRKDAHRENGADAVSDQIYNRLRPGRQRERRQDGKEVGAAGQTVEGANPKSGVGVDVMLGRSVRLSGCVHMYMLMRLAVVRVFVGVNAHGSANTPEANPEQHHADESFAPAGDEINGKYSAKAKGEDADEQHAGRVTESPANAAAPRARRCFGSERRDGGKVIRSRKHVNKSRDEPRQDNDYHWFEPINTYEAD